MRNENRGGDDEESTPLLLQQKLSPTDAASSSLDDGVQYCSLSSPQEEEEALQLTTSSSSSPSPASSSSTETTEKLICRSLLVTAAFLFGSLNVTLRWLYEVPGPPTASALSTTRGWLSVLCFIPFLLTNNNNNKKKEEEDDCPSKLQSESTEINTTTTTKPLWMAALELALWNFGAQGLANIGLLSVESARVSFLTQTSVVMTPVVSAIMGQRVHKTVWIGCICALGGLALLSDDGGFGKGLTMGDIICLGGALSWSIYIFRLSCITDHYDEVNLQAFKNFFMACLYTTWFVISLMDHKGESLWPGWTYITSWALLFYSALGPGAIADLMQQKGQTKVSASEANVILSVEPVFTAILGRLLLGEETSFQELLGGGLIISAAIIASI